ncbi:class I SAM-dependent methyltransferase [Solimicrobium silvestre]|uniref:Methyltransferase domain n=1 Tax=Solimicrobium silvestre TaxID=2099400 RepID=A0A2S9H278_9BURK|nr:class I SAM-dependent methyltransferase [Solimicrobium silvestre]PRC94068.1 Methyltransferase domain [Solimicrobium silvestre]
MNNIAQELSIAKVKRSQRYFNKASLSIYDFILYGFISKYAWGSSIQRLDAHYKKYVSLSHLEVGVGTGYLLNRIKFATPSPRLALMDLSQACLEKTKIKVSRYAPEIYVQNLLEPMQRSIPQFDSVSINYVLHCIPGSISQKCQALLHLKPLLKQDGILFGTTVLSTGVPKNLLARPAMSFLNLLGVFNNSEDSAIDLEKFLKAHFKITHFEVIGVTAFFAVKIN